MVMNFTEDMMDRVFDIISDKLGMKWVNLYRELPFYPPRGARTIESDIIKIQSECMRDSTSKEVKKSLDHWRRFHTRAKVSYNQHRSSDQCTTNIIYKTRKNCSCRCNTPSCK